MRRGFLNLLVVKSIFVVIAAYLITILATSFVVYTDKPRIRPHFRRTFEKFTGPILGYSGEPLSPEELSKIKRN